jgi:hypothetical protein
VGQSYYERQLAKLAQLNAPFVFDYFMSRLSRKELGEKEAENLLRLLSRMMVEKKPESISISRDREVFDVLKMRDVLFPLIRKDWGDEFSKSLEFTFRVLVSQYPILLVPFFDRAIYHVRQYQVTQLDRNSKRAEAIYLAVESSRNSRLQDASERDSFFLRLSARVAEEVFRYTQMNGAVSDLEYEPDTAVPAAMLDTYLRSYLGVGVALLNRQRRGESLTLPEAAIANLMDKFLTHQLPSLTSYEPGVLEALVSGPDRNLENQRAKAVRFVSVARKNAQLIEMILRMELDSEDPEEQSRLLLPYTEDYFRDNRDFAVRAGETLYWLKKSGNKAAAKAYDNRKELDNEVNTRVYGVQDPYIRNDDSIAPSLLGNTWFGGRLSVLNLLKAPLFAVAVAIHEAGHLLTILITGIPSLFVRIVVGQKRGEAARAPPASIADYVTGFFTGRMPADYESYSAPRRVAVAFSGIAANLIASGISSFFLFGSNLSVLQVVILFLFAILNLVVAGVEFLPLIQKSLRTVNSDLVRGGVIDDESESHEQARLLSLMATPESLVKRFLTKVSIEDARSGGKTDRKLRAERLAEEFQSAAKTEEELLRFLREKTGPVDPELWGVAKKWMSVEDAVADRIFVLDNIDPGSDQELLARLLRFDTSISGIMFPILIGREPVKVIVVFNHRNSDYLEMIRFLFHELFHERHPHWKADRTRLGVGLNEGLTEQFARDLLIRAVREDSVLAGRVASKLRALMGEELKDEPLDVEKAIGRMFDKTAGYPGEMKVADQLRDRFGPDFVARMIATGDLSELEVRFPGFKLGQGEKLVSRPIKITQKNQVVWELLWRCMNDGKRRDAYWNAVTEVLNWLESDGRESILGDIDSQGVVSYEVKDAMLSALWHKLYTVEFVEGYAVKIVKSGSLTVRYEARAQVFKFISDTIARLLKNQPSAPSLLGGVWIRGRLAVLNFIKAPLFVVAVAIHEAGHLLTILVTGIPSLFVRIVVGQGRGEAARAPPVSIADYVTGFFTGRMPADYKSYSAPRRVAVAFSGIAANLIASGVSIFFHSGPD